MSFIFLQFFFTTVPFFCCIIFTGTKSIWHLNEIFHPYKQFPFWSFFADIKEKKSNLMLVFTDSFFTSLTLKLTSSEFQNIWSGREGVSWSNLPIQTTLPDVLHNDDCVGSYVWYVPPDLDNVLMRETFHETNLSFHIVECRLWHNISILYHLHRNL